jgi:glutamyl/glutaminyl-tRNA synthetase
MLLKSDGFPTYHLAVVVDDHDMKISHVLRGHDWLPSTPIHLLVHKYLELPVPEIGHLTDLQDPAGGKLSKRKGNVSVEQFIIDGFLPEAILNFVILLGWAPKDNSEMFTLDEFVKAFDPAGFQKSNPLFNTQKLIWFNGQYLRRKSDEELLELVRPHLSAVVDEELLIQIIPLAKSRISTLAQFEPLVCFFWQRPEKQEQTDQTYEYLSDAYQVLENIDDWTKEVIESNLVNSANEMGWNRGEYFMALRLAVAGSKITPPLTESMIIIGRDEILARIKHNLQS